MSTSKIDFTFKYKLPTCLIYWTRPWGNSEQKQGVTLAYGTKEEIMQEAKDNGVTITGLEPIDTVAHQKLKGSNITLDINEVIQETGATGLLSLDKGVRINCPQ